MWRLKLIVFLLVSGFAPAELQRDYIFDSSGPWDSLSDAVARVRFEGHRPLSSGPDGVTLHTATVLGIFKTDPRLPPPAKSVAVIELLGFMQTEDGDWPCWNNQQPLPAGAEAMAFLKWEPEWDAFRVIFVVHLRSGVRILRMGRPSRPCRTSEK